MIINEEIVCQIYNLLTANSRVTRFPVTRNDFHDWVSTLNYINYSLDEDVNMLGGVSLDRWQVPSIFKDFVLPRRITVTGSRKERNLRFIAIQDTDQVLSSQEFNNITDGIIAAFKGKVDHVAIDSLRNTDGAIANYINRECNRAMNACKSECFPIPFIITFNRQALLVEDATEAVYEHMKATVDAVSR